MNLSRSLAQFLPRLRSAGIVVIFPSAPVRAYSLIGGAPLTVWFDRKALALDASEDSKGLAETALQIRQLVSTGLSGSQISIGSSICQVLSKLSLTAFCYESKMSA